jgi:hypothetical protein
LASDLNGGATTAAPEDIPQNMPSSVERRLSCEDDDSVTTGETKSDSDSSLFTIDLEESNE